MSSRLHVSTWGERGAPPCLVLHGITANAGAWALLGPQLAARGLLVVAPDMRGHGQSAGAAQDAATTTDQLLDDIVAVTEDHGGRPHLVIGHSFGGYLAQEALLRGAVVPDALLLEDPVSHQADAAVASAMLEHDRTTLPRSVEGLLDLNPRWTRLDAAWKVLSLEQVDWRAATAAFAGNAPWDLRGRAGDVASSVPTRWVLPPDSRFVPAVDVDELRRRAGDESVVVVPDSGHSIHRDQPGVFLAVVDELRTLAGGTR